MPNLRPFQRWMLLLLLLFAIIGLVDSVLVHLKEIDALTNPSAFVDCRINSVIDCAPVARSIYAHFLGLPVSLLGIFFYEGLLLFGITLWLGFAIPIWLRNTVTLGLVIGLLFSLRLLYYSYFGLGALCPYCLVSDACSLLVLLTWLGYNRIQFTIYSRSGCEATNL